MGSITRNKESDFQFTNPVLTGLEYVITPDFDDNDNKTVQIGTNISVEVHKTGERTAVVKLIVEIGEKSKDMPFWLKASEKANFRWNPEIDDDTSDVLLRQNAPSLLLGYLRVIVSQVTAVSVYGAYNIPFINFTQR